MIKIKNAIFHDSKMTEETKKAFNKSYNSKEEVVIAKVIDVKPKKKEVRKNKKKVMIK